MRSLIFLTFLMSLVLQNYAQNAKINQFKSKLVKKTALFSEDSEKEFPYNNQSSNSIYSAKTNQILYLRPIGTSASVLSGMWRHNVNQAFATGDANFSAYAFIHNGSSSVLSNTYGTSGSANDLIVADINKTGVNTTANWQNDFALLNDTLLKSYVINGELRATHNYPTAAIWNDGTGNPSNARVIWVSTINPIAFGDGSDLQISDWGYYSYGIAGLDGSIKFASDCGVLDSAVTPSSNAIYFTGFQQKGNTNEFWAASRDVNTGNFYLPTINIFKGTYDPVQDTMDFKVASTVDITSGTVGNPLGFDYNFDLTFGLSPDGMTGYTVAKQNYVSGYDSMLALDSMAIPTFVVWRTTDGGATWNQMPKFKIDILKAIANSGVDFNDTTHKFSPVIDSISTSTGDTIIKAYPGIIGNPTMTVDADGVPHIFAVVVPMNWADIKITGSFDYYDELGAAYDFYWDSNKNDWVAMFIDWYPGVIENVIPGEVTGAPVHISRTKNGDLINFITTRTSNIVGVAPATNDHPTMYHATYNTPGKCYSVSYKDNLWGSTYAENISAGDPNVDGNAFLIKLSPLVSGTEKMPFVGIRVFTASPTWFNNPVTWGWSDTFTVNHNCIFVTDIENEYSKNVNNVSIYPNPAQNKVNVKFDLTSASDVTLEVYNMMGQKVATTTKNNVFAANGNTMTLDVSTLNTGMYIVKFNAEGSSYSTRLMITK